jgi:hypothetical protein
MPAADLWFPVTGTRYPSRRASASSPHGRTRPGYRSSRSRTAINGHIAFSSNNFRSPTRRARRPDDPSTPMSADHPFRRRPALRIGGLWDRNAGNYPCQMLAARIVGRGQMLSATWPFQMRRFRQRPLHSWSAQIFHLGRKSCNYASSARSVDRRGGFGLRTSRRRAISRALMPATPPRSRRSSAASRIRYRNGDRFTALRRVM